jgi:hypothetical protein
MEKQLIEEISDGVATLTFNRPDRLNALSTPNIGFTSPVAFGATGGVQVPPPAPYSVHSQVASYSARQVRAQAPRVRYRARRMLPQVRPAAEVAMRGQIEPVLLHGGATVKALIWLNGCDPTVLGASA